MTTTAATPELPRPWAACFKWAAFVALLFIGSATRSVLAAETEKKNYNLPAGDAAKTLKQFVEQSGKEIFYMVNNVRGVKTKPVNGSFSAREALDHMLAETDLEAVEDARTGALSVSRRRPPSKARKPPSPAETENKPPQLQAQDPVVEMDSFQVTTALGRYAEVHSSAASKTPMDIKDLPSTVQILNAAFIGDLKAQSLADIYPYVIGMSSEGLSAVGFNLRGFSNSFNDTTLNNLQVDGLPGLASRFGSPTTANVERVEVIKGPSSVMYGFLNPGGMINVVTKRPMLTQSTSLFTSLATYAGENSRFGCKPSFTATLDSTGPIDKDKHWLYRMIVSYEDLDGFRHFAYFHNHYFFPSLTYWWDQNTELTVQVEVARQRRFSDSFLAAPFNTVSLAARYDTTYQERDSQEYDYGDTYGLSFQHKLEDRWVMRIAARDVQHQDGKYALENRSVVSLLPIENSQVVRRFRHQRNVRKYNFVDANIYGDVGADSFKHTVLFGANGGYESSDFLRLSFGPIINPNLNIYNPSLGTTPYPPDNGPTSDGITKLYNYSAYAADQVRIGAHWRASVGIRYDRQEANYRDAIVGTARTQSDHAFVPSVGLIYEPADNLSFYVSYAESFIPPLPTTVDANGKPGFDPEKASQVEAGIKSEFADHKLTALFAAYDIKKTNVAETVPGAFLPDGSPVSQLVGQQESEGIELSVTYLPVPNWQLQAGYTYDDARTTRSLNPLQVNARNWNVPRQAGNFWTRYNAPSGWLRGFGLGLGLIYVGNRLGSITNDPAQKLEMAAYTRMDAALYYQWKRYSLAVNVQNALDRAYILNAPSNFIISPGDPRKLTASLRMVF